MLSEQAKSRFAAIGMEYQPVALKFCYGQPKGYERVDEVLSFCQFAKKAQTENRAFFITREDDDCVGKRVMGMEPMPGLAMSGQAGPDFGIFRTQGANARLYHQITMLKQGACNFVLFSPLALCDFDPDLVFCVATPEQGDILMRATSYISGDIWESKSSPAIGCSWLFAYPYVSGKVNYCLTGLGHGMKRREVYPSGLMLITIPYQKLDEVVQALGEMDWVLLAMRKDPESRAELKRRVDAWQELSPEFTLKTP
jgi:uncharacterized protein (DUF169 family)